MPAARTADPDTSHAAARTAYHPTEVQQHVLEVLEYDARTNARGLTDDEIFRAFTQHARTKGWVVPTPQSLRSRRSELEHAEKVRFTGHYGTTVSGRRARRWAVAS
jgi:predicted alternative tryptophan synthase beta-subunit